MKQLFLSTFILFSLVLHGQDLTQYVNPFIGTAYPVKTNPGAIRPWGMPSVSPFSLFGLQAKPE